MMPMMVSVEAPAYVPFEPRTEQLIALRGRLRETIATLRPSQGHILHATFSGALPPGADVENALFYNLDGAGVFTAMRQGVRFEIDNRGPRSGVCYSYDTEPIESPFRCWEAGRPLASLKGTFAGRSLKLASIWWALRSTPNSVTRAGETRAPGEPFLMQLQLIGR